jgi:Ca-activated chloride channel homolog
VATAVAGTVAGLSGKQDGLPPQAPQVPRPTFRSGVEMVRVAAIVEDTRGRPVIGLARHDFELLVSGIERPIVEFGADPSPIAIAILVDGSGSMRVSPNPDLVRDAVHHVLSWITEGEDEVALFAFDRRLKVVEPFTTTPSAVAQAVPALTAFGQTSLYDAIAETSRQLAARQRARAAVVVVTDGLDTSSALDGTAVARVLTAIDVPVYVLTAAPGGTENGAPRHTSPPDALSTLESLATSTGGRLFVLRGSASASLAARNLVSELRHQYLIGFEPHAGTGWHSLILRTRQKSLTVRARSGFYAGPPVG